MPPRLFLNVNASTQGLSGNNDDAENTQVRSRVLGGRCLLAALGAA
jgi:hypothetical protein